MMLGKDCIDTGLRIYQLDPMLDSWTNEIGLIYDEMLKTGPGARKHRLILNDSSILMIKCHREEQIQTATSGYQDRYLAQAIIKPTKSQDPDGNGLTLILKGWKYVTRIGIRMNVRSLRQSASFFSEVLLATRLTNNRFRWGSVIFLVEEQADQASSGGMDDLAYRYTTIQVFKTDSEHRGLLIRGAEKGMAAVTLGDTARNSFI